MGMGGMGMRDEFPDDEEFDVIPAAELELTKNAMNLSELKTRPPAELVELAESMGLENLARSRKQDIIFSILKAHAKNAKAAIAEAKQLTPEARRHLAAMGPDPAPIRGTDRRAAILGMPKAQDLEIDLAQRAIAAEASARPAPAGIVLPEGWQLGGDRRPLPAPAPKALPPAPEGSFAAGFRRAVADHLALKRGDLIECAACRYLFDPEIEGSAPLALCGPCLAEEKGGRS